MKKRVLIALLAFFAASMAVYAGGKEDGTLRKAVSRLLSLSRSLIFRHSTMQITAALTIRRMLFPPVIM